MPVFRVNKTYDYTVMCMYHFREKGMSLKAKGLLSMMLSLPDNWDYSIEGLVGLSADGKGGVMSALNELKKFGYLKMTRVTDDNHRFAGYNYDVYEKPYSEIPYTEKPNTEKPYAEKPYSENPLQYNIKEYSIKEYNTNNLGGNPQKRFSPPTVEEIEAYCRERGNDIDAEKFFDHYTSNGWMVGKTKMKDWKASVRTWEKNGYQSDKKIPDCLVHEDFDLDDIFEQP